MDLSSFLPYVFILVVVVGWLVPFMRHEIDRRRHVDQWYPHVTHRPDGLSLFTVEATPESGIAPFLLSTNRGLLLAGVTFDWNDTVPFPEGKCWLTFKTDKRAHISGRATFVQLAPEVGMIALENAETAPTLVRALADAERRFELWAWSPSWKGDKHRQLRLEGFREPALRLLKEAEQAEAVWAELMASDELFPSDPNKRIVN